MKHKTWFRLVLKAIGVLVIAFGAPQVFRELIGHARWGLSWGTAPSQMSSMSPADVIWHLLSNSGPDFLLLGIGLYLLIGGERLVRFCIPSNRPYCADCGYDLSEQQGSICPECGVNVEAVLRLYTRGSSSATAERASAGSDGA